MSVLWIKHTLFWDIPSLWLSLQPVSSCAHMLGIFCLSICWHWAFLLNGWDEVKGQYPLVYEIEFSEASYFVLRNLTNNLVRLVWFSAAGFHTSHCFQDIWSESSLEAYGRAFLDTLSNLRAKIVKALWLAKHILLSIHLKLVGQNPHGGCLQTCMMRLCSRPPTVRFVFFLYWGLPLFWLSLLQGRLIALKHELLCLSLIHI